MTSKGRPDRRATRVLFAALTLLGGLGLMVATPPLGAPDEIRHLIRAYLVSQGDLRPPGRDPATRPRAPRSLAQLGSRMDHSEPFNRPRRFTPADIDEALDQPLAPEERVGVGFIGANAPLAYVPQALAIAVGRVFEPAPAALLYLGRAANLLAYLALGLLALRLTPLRPLALALALLIPMSLAQAASLSPDAVTLAGTTVFAAALARSATKRGPMGRREAFGLLALGALLALLKLGYAPLAGLALLVPARRFARRSQRIALLAGMLLAALLPSMLWLAFVQAVDPLPGNAKVNPQLAVRWLTTYPGDFIALVVRTFGELGSAYVQSGIGILGHLNIPLPAPVVLLCGTTLVLACVADEPDSAPFDWRARAVCFGLFAIGCFGILLLAFVGWSHPSDRIIEGVQGRYFLPLLPLLWLALPGGVVPGATRIRVPLLGSAAALWLGVTVWTVGGAFFGS